MLDTVINIIKKAGLIALNRQSELSIASKNDKSPVTNIDIEVSNFIKKELAHFINNQNHIFIDEEDFETNPTQWDDFNKSEYAWFIDPISGTLSYLNGIPLYGISIGLLKNKKPYLGAVYLPCLNELYWFSNGKAFYQNQTGQVQQLSTNDHKITPFSLFFINMHQRFTLSEKVCRTTSFMAVQPGYVWSAIGRFTGALTKVKVWDFAGAWGICNACGLNFYTLETGKKITEISSDHFDKNWKMKQPLILASEKNIDILRANIKPIV